jgi:phosphomannomutase/phosphoglucomutase
VGGEFAAHVFIKDRWYGFDDGIYTAARIAEVLSQSDKSCSEIFSAFESTIGTAEIKLAVDEREKFALMHRIEDLADFEDARLITLDGVRAEFADGWGLVRASNTSPALLLRFEAQSEKSLERIKNRFKALISKADNSLVLNF